MHTRHLQDIYIVSKVIGINLNIALKVVQGMYSNPFFVDIINPIRFYDSAPTLSYFAINITHPSI